MVSNQHRDRVHAAVGVPGAGAARDISASWLRSLNDFRIDPGSVRPPSVLTQRELKEFREPRESLIEIARGELTHLYSLVRDAGYVVLLCDANGIAIDHRGNEREADQFKYWGIWLGGVWSEDVEGTNGIGTCIAMQRAVAVHRTQHFRARHVGLSCSGAPIFDPDGNLAGVLDVSSMDPAVSETAHALSLPITADAARAIERQMFRKRFNHGWVIALSSDSGDAEPITMAVDADQRIMGADRHARQALNLDDQSLRNGASLWTHFERDASCFGASGGEDIPAQFRRRSDDGLWRAIVTTPVTDLRSTGRAAEFRSPTWKPADTPPPGRAPQRRGGLAPSVLRRVQDHVEARLRESISLEELSDVAGLSVWHFARAFRQAVGVTPHNFVLQRRITRAHEMLTETDLSISEIAFSLGFTDQSHFARQFRRRIGMTPGEVRRNRVDSDRAAREGDGPPTRN